MWAARPEWFAERTSDMENKWHEIWEKRSAKLAGIDRTDYQAVFAELKRINGFIYNVYMYKQ